MAWLVGELERERVAQAVTAQHRAQTILQALRDPQVLLFSAAYFFGLIASNGLSCWLPTMMKSFSGFSNVTIAFLVSLPYSLGVAAKLLAGWSSDRTGERRWDTAGLLSLGSVGLVACVLVQGHLLLALA